MSKIIVTHLSPDLDAVCSVWLIKRFLWEEAEVKFVPPGKFTFNSQPVDKNPEVLYVDTGRGRFDHHQKNKYICSATLVWQFIQKKSKKKNEAVERILAIVNEVDHARHLVWPEPDSDRYEMMLHSIFEGFNQGKSDKGSQKIIDFGLEALDGVYKIYQKKVCAEEELKKGKKFETRWGKAIAIETKNKEFILLAEKRGYSVVVQLNKEIGNLKIYARWDRKVDLTRAWEEIKKKDPKPFWFLHSSKAILVNGTPTQPDYEPTKLSLAEVIAILQKA